MTLPTFDAFPHRDLSDITPGRAYRVTPDTELVAFHVEAVMPHAPDGFYVYAFVGTGSRVGHWNWTADPEALGRIMEAFRAVTDPGYVPPDWTAPGGEAATVHPPDRDLVNRLMDEARPDHRAGALPEGVIPLRGRKP